MRPSTLPMGRVRPNPNVSADEGDLDTSQYDLPNVPTSLLFEHATEEKEKLEGNKPMRKRPQQGISARKADTVKRRRTRSSTATSGSDQQGPSGSAGRSGDAHPDSTSHDEDCPANSSNNMDLPPQSSRQSDVPHPTTSTPKKRSDAASATRKQMHEHDKAQKGLKTVTFANPAAERLSTRPRKRCRQTRRFSGTGHYSRWRQRTRGPKQRPRGPNHFRSTKQAK